MKHTIEEVVGVTREIDGVVYENAQRANCLLNAANALEKAVEDKKHITLHKAFHAIKDMKIYRKPLVNEGTMGNGKKLEDYSSIAVKFNTKSMYVLTISTYSRLISSGWDETRVELRLSDDLIEEFDKIGEIFFSYEGASDVEPEYNPEFGGVEPEDDNYWDKDRSEYVNRFTEDVEYNWDARYNHYTPIFKRSLRDDEPEFSGTFYNSQYSELVMRNKARFAAASKDKKFSLGAPSFQTSEAVGERLRELNMNRQKTSFTYGFEKFAV